jgi:hypothetical protein
VTVTFLSDGGRTIAETCSRINASRSSSASAAASGMPGADVLQFVPAGDRVALAAAGRPGNGTARADLNRAAGAIHLGVGHPEKRQLAVAAIFDRGHASIV